MARYTNPGAISSAGGASCIVCSLITVVYAPALHLHFIRRTRTPVPGFASERAKWRVSNCGGFQTRTAITRLCREMGKQVWSAIICKGHLTLIDWQRPQGWEHEYSLLLSNSTLSQDWHSKNIVTCFVWLLPVSKLSLITRKAYSWKRWGFGAEVKWLGRED